MKKYEFLCGGDFGVWECLVEVWLTDEEAGRLIEYAQINEFLEKVDPVKDVYRKVYAELKEQCTGHITQKTVLIRVPTGLRKDGL